ncbi:zinc dependent phospholipase C family protein [Adhaeribacter terrigena]|uniref:zinc dependent phospholipase C family protein n=1 Tax=Adhaeribacter terrigena TaxID=2793070 RepID=UPI001F422947|nr:zinc dependent phospholipase C family protein [Adhaeribacter terrigena]
MKRLLLFLLLNAMLWPQKSMAWGFYAHRRIDRLAVFTLPPEMIGFYKKHIVYITETSTKPDSRRTLVPDEAPKHYIDLDVYGDSAVYKLPRFWKDAVAKYTEDTLMAYGIVPWHINLMKFQLTEAFKARDTDKILRLSSEMGHYIADACVPLHTTQNYNGQLTNQRGIHALWESRLPELLAHNYDFFVGRATYLENPQLRAWDAVTRAHLALDSVLRFEKEVTESFDEDRKYSFEDRNGVNTRVYSRDFCEDYHRKLNGQVERQMRYAIALTGSFWYTCWVDAGQPDLNKMAGISEKELQNLKEEAKPQPPVLPVRPEAAIPRARPLHDHADSLFLSCAFH